MDLHGDKPSAERNAVQRVALIDENDIRLDPIVTCKLDKGAAVVLDALEQLVLRFLKETFCLLFFVDTRIKRERPYEHAHGAA